MLKRWYTLAYATGAMTVSLAASASADESDQRTGADAIMEEVVVTARRREEGLQSAPIAISAYTGDSLDYRGVTKLDQIAKFAPSLTLENNPSFGGASNSAAIYIRGIGQKEFLPTTEPGVGLYVDGVYVARSVGAILDIVDVERVEVLRGPQGTLYGRGATAGAINMVTSKPGDELGGYLNFTAGNYGLAKFQGAVDVPLGDAFAMRLATSLEQRDGYGTNIFTGSDVNNRDAQAVRATFAYDSGGPFTGMLSLQYYEEDDNNYAFNYFGQSQGSAAPVPLAVIFMGGQTIDMVGGGFYDINSDQEALNDREGQLANLTLNWELSDSLSVRSITSVQSMDRFLRDDLDSTDANLFGQNNYTEESDSFGQEFILNYSTDRLDVIAGVMYFDEELYGEVRVPLTNICNLLAPELCGTPVGDGLNSGNYLQDGDVDIEAWGAYAEATFRLSDQFAIIGGLRYNYEERAGTGSFIFDAIGLNVPTDQRASWNDVTPRVTIQ